MEGIFNLNTLWFALIGLLWAVYFILDGFDFGVGTLLPYLGRDDNERRVLINSVGPVWDGNEVWLLVAGGATFAAFPVWYATLFSGFYLALFLMLVALIIRAVAFEFRGKEDSVRWRANWDRAIFFGSALPALLWGVAFANILRGVPIDAQQNYAGTFFTLLNPYAILGGLASLSMFTLHGALFVALKSTGDLHARTRRLIETRGWLAVLITGAFFAWTYFLEVPNTGVVPGLVQISAAIALLAIPYAYRSGSDLAGFLTTSATLALSVAAIFIMLYPAVMPSSIDAAYNLTVFNASSSPLTLRIMSIVTVVITPIVIAYQAWAYWIFRHRISVEDIASSAAH